MSLLRILTALCLLFLLSSLVFGCGDDDDDDNDSGVAPDDDVVVDDDAVDDDDDAVDDDDDDDSVDDDDDDTTDDDDDSVYPDYPNDDLLSVNMVQALGTHNSYHVQRNGLAHPEHHYSHQPLYDQLDIGVRQFELDMYWRSGRVEVFHIPVIDPVSTCETLVDCLSEMKQWSDDNPGHIPLVVLLEPKVLLGDNPFIDHFEDVESEILSVWPEGRILMPDDVRGDYGTLKEAITTDGWPTLREARDRIILHFHTGGDLRDAYLDGAPSLEGRMMFVDSYPEADFAGIMPMNDPIGQQSSIQTNVEAGFLVRTRADSCCDEAIAEDYTRFNAALSSGAHAVSTDFPAPVDDYDYWIEIPDGNPARCNPLTAPVWCTSADIENLL